MCATVRRGESEKLCTPRRLREKTNRVAALVAAHTTAPLPILGAPPLAMSGEKDGLGGCIMRTVSSRSMTTLPGDTAFDSSVVSHAEESPG